MLTKLKVKNFRLFEGVELDLDRRVVFVGPNNAGKTVALQSLALWDIGRRRWTEKRGAGDAPAKRPGVTINRRDLIAVPVPETNLLWRDLNVRSSSRAGGKLRTENVRIELLLEGVDDKQWSCGFEFDYANPESFYCRPLQVNSGARMSVPEDAAKVRIAYLPPMSGLTANETKLDPGAISVRLGEGRTAEVLRNICYQILESERGEEKWEKIVHRIDKAFGCRLLPPSYVKERGEIAMAYKTRGGVKLDISASGRGQQQTLLLLAYMTDNPGAVLLLDEPDAHLEILRQRQIYDLLGEIAQETKSQIIAASHSEVVLNEAGGRGDTLIAFVGKPHKIDNVSQAAKALKEIGFEHYLQAEIKGWILYLEGSTDLSILRQFAKILKHEAEELLIDPYVHYVSNQPSKARPHFYGLREAKPNLKGIAIFDRLDANLKKNSLIELMWGRNEIENYLCQRQVLLSFAHAEGNKEGELFGEPAQTLMESSISEIERAMHTLQEPSPWGDDCRASEFLEKIFGHFYSQMERPNMMPKSRYGELVKYLEKEDIDGEVTEKLDAIVEVAKN